MAMTEATLPPTPPEDEPLAEPLTFALIHGGGDVGWAWHLVEAELRSRGHGTVAIDLPIEDPGAGFREQAAAVVDAVGDASRVVVAGHSFGGFTAPIVADALPGAIALVFVAGMVPRPGERPADWWVASGYTDAEADGAGGDDDTIATYYADVEPALAQEALSRGRGGANAGYDEPWPLDALPDLPTRALLFRQDRFFAPAFMRSMVKERLGLVADEMDGSHGAMLSRPVEIAAYLEQVAEEAGVVSG